VSLAFKRIVDVRLMELGNMKKCREDMIFELSSKMPTLKNQNKVDQAAHSLKLYQDDLKMIRSRIMENTIVKNIINGSL